jgi:hypothetical protein
VRRLGGLPSQVCEQRAGENGADAGYIRHVDMVILSDGCRNRPNVDHRLIRSVGESPEDQPGDSKAISTTPAIAKGFIGILLSVSGAWNALVGAWSSS